VIISKQGQLADAFAGEGGHVEFFYAERGEELVNGAHQQLTIMLLVDAAVLGPVDVVHGLDARLGAEDADVFDALPGLHGALVSLHLFAGAGGRASLKKIPSTGKIESQFARAD